MNAERTGSGTKQVNRRTVLQAGGVLSLVILTGCLGDDQEESEETPTPDATETPAESDGEDTPEPPADDTTDGTDDEPTERDDESDDLDPETLEARAREFVEFLDTGAFEEAHEQVAPLAAADLDVETLSMVWDSLIEEDGELQEVLSAEHQGVEAGFEFVLVDVQFAAGRQEFELYFDETGLAGFFVAPPGEWDVPEYVDESAFTEEELTLDATDTCSLGATLSVPESDEAVPGVVLVHGNGPHDRDKTAFEPNRPFKELAWGLASNGIAVLRYDKRNFACEVDPANWTIDDKTTDDALVAVDTLREDDRVADDQVFVVGHSFGGALAPRIAERDGALAGIVMLAPGPVRSMAETIRDQNRHLYDIGVIDEEELDEATEIADRVESLDIGDGEVVHLGGRELYESFEEYDRTGTLADLDIPRWLAFGGRDYQITVDDDLPVWADAIEDDDGATLDVYDELNHLFQESEGEMRPDEYFEEGGVFSARVVDDVVEFVRDHE